MSHKLKLIQAVIGIAAMISSCQMQGKKDAGTADSATYAKGTYGYDLDFLKKNDSVLVLKNEDGLAQIIVSAKYRGKVFTSTADGLKGRSFGWINYKTFAADTDSHMNAYGSEDRLWLGPEGGKFSLFFKPGTKMEFPYWHTPKAFDTEAWKVVSSDTKKVSLTKDMDLINYAGTQLKIKVDRDIAILDNATIENDLGVKLAPETKAVGFKTDNSLTNAGTIEWTQNTGAPCMWNPDMFTPSPKVVIIIPYNNAKTAKIATTDYFGQIPADRISYKNNVLYFKADGKSRGKLGITPKRAMPVIGSYDAENNVLTIAKFDIDNNGLYLNQEWRTDREPLSGDAVNSYNDGPLANGSQMGPFYEIESVSPAAFLKPGGKLQHQHKVFHFTGDKAALNSIAQKVLGVSLADVEGVFK
ncbi:hypothetical protein HK413_03965 [Mucilaginibacter sp. S1162]|uniref:DUF4380 domain-containing protein n=1 Tax=Mucilaginibacter humi TaxID=2732510 RepID=A0ABX1W0R3_9SPHI|nr:DUF6786 family protein [Mucilaginibacter humi]NNU33518.1 hypothetical protein [Mucilaginibacter humi]